MLLKGSQEKVATCAQAARSMGAAGDSPTAIAAAIKQIAEAYSAVEAALNAVHSDAIQVGWVSLSSPSKKAPRQQAFRAFLT
jgi:hypothetical protein